jgi:CDP-diacylglycerol---serine O-phosphatidyltransferase
MKKTFPKSSVANFITTLNIFSGFLSIIFASEGNFRIASLMIIAAAIFDMLDGIVARLLSTSSRFGVELDSISDVVSFGAAPAFLIYKAHLYQFGYIGIVLSACLLVFGALRLARFNIQVEDLTTKGDFKGLPIPLSAMTIALLVLSFYQDGKIAEPFTGWIIPLVLLLSVLMVSTIRYNALPKLKDKNFKQKLYLLAILVAALLLAILTNGEVLFFIFFGIVIFGILRKLILLIISNKDDNNNGN